MKTVNFRESQKFKQYWLWIIMLVFVGIWIWGIVQQIIFNIPFGNNPTSDDILLLIGIVPIGLCLLLFQAKLITEVKKDGIYIKFLPFHFKYQKISYNDIKKYEVIEYLPLRDYGGWGIRYNFFKKEKAYNLHGKIGLQLEFKNGKKLLIGTQKPDEIIEAINCHFARLKKLVHV